MGDIVWHGHHRNTCPIEELSGTLTERQEDIRRNKPENEQAIRLKLLQPCSPQAAQLFRQYQAAEAPLLAQYEAAEAPLWAQYRAVENVLWVQYEAAEAELLAKDPADEAAGAELLTKYLANEDTLLAQYQATVAPLRAQYWAARVPLLQPILDLHHTECGCTEWNGNEIVFPNKENFKGGTP